MIHNTNQVSLPDNIAVVKAIRESNLSNEVKADLEKKLHLGQLDTIQKTQEMLCQSGVAQIDIGDFLNRLDTLNKQGMYATSKLEAKTGSGKIEMRFKGGDPKLIIPVLIIVGIVIVAVVFIIYGLN